MINAPWGFSTAFSVIKGYLDEVTAKKIHILGSSYKSELLKQIPAENLPKKFGGTSDSPGGVELSDEGPWTDAKYASPASQLPPSQGTNSNIIRSRPTSVAGSLHAAAH